MKYEKREIRKMRNKKNAKYEKKRNTEIKKHEIQKTGNTKNAKYEKREIRKYGKYEKREIQKKGNIKNAKYENIFTTGRKHVNQLSRRSPENRKDIDRGVAPLCLNIGFKLKY